MFISMGPYTKLGKWIHVDYNNDNNSNSEASTH